jgi:hypothetical protein
VSYLTDPQARGTTATAGSPQSSVAVTTTATIPVGAVLLARVGTTYDGDLGASGATNYHATIEDDFSNLYAKLGECSQVGSQGDPTISLWLCHVTTEIPSGSSLTAGFSQAMHGRVIGLVAYTLDDPTSTLELVDLAVEHAADHGGGAMTITLTLGAEEELTWLVAGADNDDSGEALTLDGIWTTDLPKLGTSGAGAYQSTTIWGQMLAANADEETWTGTHRNWFSDAYLLAALRVVPPPIVPIPGIREYQVDFETESFHVDGTSTTRRPDGVSLDYLTAYSRGPKALGDLSDGIYPWTWRVRAEGLAVYLARENALRDGWLDEELLTICTGSAPIDELDLAFTEEGTVVVVCERATGTAGAPQVHIYWWNPTFGIEAYDWLFPFNGRTPRCVLDYFPTSVGPHVCPPEIDVQVFYLLDGTGMLRREQASSYGTASVTVLPNSTATRLHRAFRTTDRRVSVLLSRHTPATGRFVYERVDSVPFRDSLLARPSFWNWSSPSFDLVQSGEQAWAMSGVTTNAWALRVGVVDDVDGVEIVCAATYPSGDDSVFTEQAQSYGAVTAGGWHDFSVNITSGEGTMDLVAFRARTWRDVGEVTCYSPWRYLMIAASWPMADPDDIVCNCDRDLILDVPARLEFARHGLVEATRTTLASARGDTRPFVCTDLPAYDATSFPTWFFIGGVRNYGAGYPFPTHYPEYVWRRRAYEPINFADEDGSYVGTQIGAPIEGGGGGTPPDLTWTFHRWPAEFPNDQGKMPTAPVSANIVGDTG